MPQQNQLRIARYSAPGRVYHMVTTTADRVPYFRDFTCARTLIRCMIHEMPNVETLAYCLMPNHLHWLFQLKRHAVMDEIMQAVKSVSSHRMNRRLGRKGPLWMPGYYDRGLRQYNDPNTTIDYILRNPIKARIVKDIRNYPHWDAKEIPGWVMEG